MRTAILASLILISMVSFAGKAAAQDRKSVDQKREERNFYRKTIQVDSAKADQVVQIQMEYKKNLSVVMADSGLTDNGRRAKIQLLITEKNKKLKRILTPLQQQKVIPTTEREEIKVPGQF